MPNQIGGVFWAVINRLLIIFQVIILLLSEIGWPSVFFDRFFPVLGSDFGLGALGIFQGLLVFSPSAHSFAQLIFISIGAAVLSQYVDDFALVSALFLFVLGCMNMLLGLIFRESAKRRRSITSWRDRAKDLLPTTTLPSVPHLNLNHTGSSGSGRSFASSTLVEEKARDLAEFGAGLGKAGYGFGRQGEKTAALKGRSSLIHIWQDMAHRSF